MELCFNSHKDRITTCICSLFGFSIGFFLVILAVTLLFQHPVDILLYLSCMILFLTGCSICGLFLFFFVVYSREYSVDSNGITIRYFKRYKVKYPWKDIGAVIVCDVNHAPKNADNFDLVIRLSMGIEKNGPSRSNELRVLSRNDRWRRSEYGIMHFQKVILIEYSESRLAQIQEMSQKDVVYLLTRHGKARIQNR